MFIQEDICGFLNNPKRLFQRDQSVYGNEYDTVNADFHHKAEWPHRPQMFVQCLSYCLLL